MMTPDQVVPGAHVVRSDNGAEYQIDRIDYLTDKVYIYNYLVLQSIPIVEFLRDYDLSYPLPKGNGNKSYDLDLDLCDHEYVEYYGLKESFKYCKKCDKRE